MVRTKVKINPEILKWAIQWNETSIELLAGSLKVPRGKVIAWVKGKEYPSFRKAQDIANKLRIPFGYLFLKEPPKIALPLPDFRVFPEEREQVISPDLLEVMYDVMRKQDWLKERRLEESFKPLEFIGKFDTHTPPTKVAEDIRRYLPELKRRSFGSYIKELVSAFEDLGITIFRSGVVKNNTHRRISLKDFRGFVIVDEIAPVIFINTNDAKSAQIFTLLHEIAHLWIGQSGIVNVYPIKVVEEKVEWYCNKVAASFLIPEEELDKHWNPDEDIQNALDRLSLHFKVSRMVILIRLFNTNRINEKLFYSIREEILKSYNEQKKKRKPGGNSFANIMARNSTSFVKEVISALNEGKIYYKEAAGLLNVSLYTIETIRKRVTDEFRVLP